MAMPYVFCDKCGARSPAGSGFTCSVCGSSLELRQGAGWRWLAAHEWFVLIAAIAAGIGAFINS